MDDIDKAAIEQRADTCWELMTDNERSMVRIGMSPHWCFLEDLDGRAEEGQVFEAIEGSGHRELALAFMDRTKKIGGMVV